MNRRRVRLDAALVSRGLARSRGEARELVDAGRVTIAGAPATKVATLVAADEALVVADDGPRWASRGGGKLDGALDRLHVPVAGRYALDAGASTGGFTDVLLARGAARVVAVDVGYGQLDWRLASDERVVVLDRTNVRHLEPDALPSPPPDLVVADLSFISLALVIPALVRVAATGADHVLLCKPQFEAGRGQVPRDGVVRDQAVWLAALRNVVEAGQASGLGFLGAVPSPVRGPAGNVEFFVHLRGPSTVEDAAAAEPALKSTVDEAAGATP